jgi:Lrp/AsnC family transcriptional regulator, regulator for asnA, asnC and gidA
MNLDDIDLEIVRLLQEDGRQGNRSVARQMGLSEGAVRKRIRRMEDEEAIVYGLLVDVGALGPALWFWLDIEVKPVEIDAVATFIAAFQCCTLCTVITTNLSIRASGSVPDRAALAKLVDDIAGRPGVLDVTAREVVGFAHHQYQFKLHSDTWGGRDRET